MNKNAINNLIQDKDDTDLIFLGSVKDETKGFDFEGSYEPKDHDKIKPIETEIDAIGY